jgi:inner membrane protein
MDSLTHLAIGACMGEAFAGKKLGKKAILWGAAAQSIPDIDFVASLWMDTPSSLLAHRGFTHSFLFCVLITPMLAFAAMYLHRPHNIRLRNWMLFFGGVILAHILVDAFNNYGVGWFEPFSHERISFNAIYVADPLFSVWPGMALVALLYYNRYAPKRRKWWRLGLMLPGTYLLLCLMNKSKIDADVKMILRQQQVNYTRYFTTPAPLQNWLWFVVAGNDSGYYVGFRSLFDSKRKIDFQYFPRNDSLLKPVDDHEALQQLTRFSKEFYTVEKWHDTLVFNDLRFGQVIGWHNPREKFVFHYYLQHPEDNSLVVQRGRFTGWNWSVVKRLIGMTAGN